MRRWLPWLALLGLVVGFANFLWFARESADLGGDALNGFIRDGHYYIAKGRATTEVSRATWEWSRIHAVSFFVTGAGAMAGLAYLLFTEVFPLAMGSRGDPATLKEVERIRASGPPIASARTGGRLGDLYATTPLVSVTVYSAGVVIRPVVMSAFAIPAERLRGLARRRVFLTPAVWLEHDDPRVPSRVALYLGENDPVIVALRAMASHGASIGPSSEATAAVSKVVRHPVGRTIWESSSPVGRAMILASFVFAVAFVVTGVASSEPSGNVIVLAIVLVNAYTFFLRRLRS
jgi:hypothetical protein